MHAFRLPTHNTHGIVIIMELGEIKFLNAFNAIPGVGAVTLRRLKKHFGSFEAAWRAHPGAYAAVEISPQARTALGDRKSSLDPDREMQKLVQNNIWTITDDDSSYPPSLKEISSPPAVLYGRGEKTALATPHTVAVVGTRRPTPYGIEATEAVVAGLAPAGVTVVSGLATGIDTKAHKTALEHRGVTVAVLGSGVDPMSLFPPENRGLSERIAVSGGAVISEYAPGTPAVKEHFPMRNRIIAGISQGTLVVEAREKSGALITARLALEENRDVFAIPGSIFSAASHGPNRLIQQGAKPVHSAQDIFEELGIDGAAAMRHYAAQSLGRDETMVLNLTREPCAVDDIRLRSGLSSAAVVASLALLEFKGLVRNLGADTYQQAPAQNNISSL